MKLFLLLDIFSNICNLPLKGNKISTVSEFVDSFFSGIYKTSFICQLCQEQIFTMNPSPYYCTTVTRQCLFKVPDVTLVPYFSLASLCSVMLSSDNGIF